MALEFPLNLIHPVFLCTKSLVVYMYAYISTVHLNQYQGETTKWYSEHKSWYL